jgi:NhaP-type Na+/H+ or K+/H+ antiporter
MELYLSFALVMLVCLAFSKIMEKLSLPALLGYMAAGFLLGPAVLNVLSADFLSLSGFLRKFALIVILSRAGLKMDFQKIKENGASALMLCFVPACFEIAGYMCLGLLLHLDLLNAALLGCVMSAVSPAVIVPRMISIDSKGYGRKQGVCQMILAGASMDDIFVITVFSVLLSAAQKGAFSWSFLYEFPLSVLSGIAAGILLGKAVRWTGRRFSLLPVQILIALCALSFVFVWIEDSLSLPFSSLLAVLVMHYMQRGSKNSEQVVSSYENIWKWAEMLLFSLIGTMVSIEYMSSSFGVIVLVMFAALLFRMTGVFVSLLPSKMDWKTKLFCMIAYLPKATVQAGIGSLPLAAGLASGELILSFAAASIVITAPLGAFLIDRLYPVLLSQD